jgi:N-acetylmuramoyl-L-alanine amidase
MGRKILKATILFMVSICLVLTIPVKAQNPTKSIQAVAPGAQVSPQVITPLCTTAPVAKAYGTADSAEPQAIYGAGQYLGCAVAKATGTTEQSVSRSPAPNGNATPIAQVQSKPAEFQAQPTPIIQKSLSPINIASLPAGNLEVAEVVVENAVTRTGPNSNYNRVTPLPKGTKATVVGRQDGDNNGKLASFVQLDYGGWVLATDLKTTNGAAAAPKAIVQSVQSQNRNGHTELRFPLATAVPISIEQQEKSLKLTLYNTTAQNKVVKLNGDPTVSRLDWKAHQPSQVEYNLAFKSRQQWGYKYRYEGNTLVLSLKHPPKLNKSSHKPLTGTKIFIDPGHGGTDSGAVGANGYTEKEATLFAAKLLGNELAAKGAQVYLSREVDKAVSLDDRRAMVESLDPTISISVHYNSLPEGRDPLKSKGFSTYWYHAQAQGLADFLHNYVVDKASRPRDGVKWDNLALARPTAAPSVLLELGFMSNPEELEWIANPTAQQQMSQVLANGITQWLLKAS